MYIVEMKSLGQRVMARAVGIFTSFIFTCPISDYGHPLVYRYILRSCIFKGIRLHLQSLKRVERAVQSHKGGTNVAPSEGSIIEGQLHPSPVEDANTKALKEKLKTLRIGVKDKRRQLRRAAKNDVRESFSASSFKTGRGRW